MIIIEIQGRGKVYITIIIIIIIIIIILLDPEHIQPNMEPIIRACMAITEWTHVHAQERF